MKLPSLVLALLLLLCGCAAQREVATEPTSAPPPAVTEPAGIYDAESRTEKSTFGAVKAYPLGLHAESAASMGQQILLFSGVDTTTLTVYCGENLRPVASLTLDCKISADDGSVQVRSEGLTYYDRVRNELVFLDTRLKEYGRAALPENICGSPAVSADIQKIYYCTADSLRCTDLQTGLDRLVKEMRFPLQSAAALHCDDAVVACDIVDESGEICRLYVSAETGQLLYEDTDEVALQTHGASYFAAHKDGIYTEFLTGSSEHGPTLLTPLTYDPAPFPLLTQSGLVTVTETDVNAVQLDHYDLRSGKRTASVTFDEIGLIRSVFVIENTENIWFLGYSPAYDCDVLYCWDLSKSPADDGRNYLSARHSAQNPDLAALAACREIADNLSYTYGVQILLWTDATSYQPWDYTLIPEYQVPVIRQNLMELEQFLSMYPKGFLEKAAELTSSGRIQICLVRSIRGKAEGTVSEAVGLQYWDHNRNSYLCLQVQPEGLSRNACHEMSHIIDSRVLTVCRAYDDWNKLNPAGFHYRGNQYASLPDGEQHLIAGDTRAFIDTYSMSYPKEDRARIMEFAMADDGQHYFESEIMQKKLHQICLGIREAFGLKNSSESFRWEQYLKAPLSKK